MSSTSALPDTHPTCHGLHASQRWEVTSKPSTQGTLRITSKSCLGVAQKRVQPLEFLILLTYDHNSSCVAHDGVQMSVRRVGFLAVMAFPMVLWVACGQVYRPGGIPC